MKTSVLMTDPRHFAIRGGANPHTRNDDDSLKVVNQSTALKQWNRYVDQLLDTGVDVYVIDSAPDLTGMVFAANAGFIPQRYDTGVTGRTFYPSRFTAKHRRPESVAFKHFFEEFGFRVADVPGDLKFEGEADGYPIGKTSDPKWIFTYGFRSDPEVGDWLESEVGEPFVRMKLQDPRFYHGDCLVCTLGDSILAWEPGLEAGAREKLSALADTIWITTDDAEAFIGNSFYAEVGGEKILFSPVALRDDLCGEIEERGVRVIRVDISEFFTKGGGGPKCMVFNLGELDSAANNAFANERSIGAWRARNS